MFEIENSLNLGINMIALFLNTKKKNLMNAEEALNNDNLICRTLKKLKKFPELIVICDIALDAYTLSGHDGIINIRWKLNNDKTIKILKKCQLNFAKNGCDIAPSDMMDGRVGAIREELENE